MAEQRISLRLFAKKQQQAAKEAEPPPPPPRDPAQGGLPSDWYFISPAARRNRLYRMRLKDDPDRYKAQTKKAADRKKRNRANMTPEQKDKERESTRARVAKCREQKKELGLPLNNPPKVMTRQKLEGKRAKDRDRQRKHRAEVKANPQKRGWETRRKAMKALKKSLPPETPLPEPEPLKMPNSSEKEAAKLVKKYAGDPSLLASVVNSVVEVAQENPELRQAFEENNIMPAAAREAHKIVHDEVKKRVQELKPSKKSANAKRRALLANVLIHAHKGKGLFKYIRRRYGFSYSYLKKCANGAWTRKNNCKCNAISSATV